MLSELETVTVPEAPDTVNVPLDPWFTLSEVVETVRLLVVEVTVTLMVRLRLESRTVIVALPARRPLTVTTPLRYLAVATDEFDEETETLPEAPVTLAVPDEPWAMRREAGLTLRLLLDDSRELLFLFPLSPSAKAENPRNIVRAMHMRPLNRRRLDLHIMAIPLSVITMWEIFPPAHYLHVVYRGKSEIRPISSMVKVYILVYIFLRVFIKILLIHMARQKFSSNTRKEITSKLLKLTTN